MFIKKNLLKTLRASALFKNINDSLIQDILNKSKIVEFEKKKVFSENELKNSIFIVLNGMVKSYQVNPYNGKAYTIFLFNKSEVFDIITFVDKEKHGVIFETLEKTLLLKISHNTLNSCITKESKLNQNIISLLSSMFLKLEQNTTELALYDTFTRLSKLILRNISIKPILSRKLTPKVKLNALDKLSHEDLANLIGTAREVVSRHIKTLKEKNILETVEKKHHIINIQSLIKQCDLDV